ncbi:MAG: Holliday junction branch migration protein RuvA [Candidatus Magasanikbacteria bacterium]|jgi:holliday junction DNA helicase RuvA|nr:Holliday junction branch migration protein RuvA [Candidatus Magasanikbacteria bacterium]MBT5262815.1 Holliday junction branch migration protein RuvA [Candidatus Magasanikbacteria bacterium]MBT5820061.1 Holliday junction branch migration protein RuvA [Candidatus Magasanikbacteria bacterium]MBT6294664.1 Holliday junction branch migration protein RuvA [Candidatus Magasanikbacteria bacterium]
MIAFLEGKIIALTSKNLVLLTPGGIGYEINTPKTQLEHYSINQSVQVFTYLKVSEKSMELFGFATQKQKDFFCLLLSVKSVGPKSAMHILGLGPIEDTRDAIARKDAAHLCAVQGMGKKTAERLVVELHTKIDTISCKEPMSETQESVFYETVDGLVALGYSKQEATTCVKTIFSVEETTATLLKKALQLMQR